jgi:hypothetical protein
MDFGEMEKNNKKCINMAVGVPIDETPKLVI